jgi:hypothetical protein
LNHGVGQRFIVNAHGRRGFLKGSVEAHHGTVELIVDQPSIIDCTNAVPDISGGSARASLEQLQLA